MLDLDKMETIFTGTDFDMAYGCSEPGYDDKLVLLADWNQVPGKVFDKLEDLGYACEWIDEWITCADCGKAFRQSPTSYGWEFQGLWVNDCELVCRECWKDSYDDILTQYVDNHKRAVPSGFTDILLQNGFVCWQTDDGCVLYETGWHPGQNDNPESVLNEIKANDPRWQVVFALTSVGQFDVRWTAFIKLEN